jgi:hypothetical protein
MHKQGKLWSLWLAPAIGALVVAAAAYVAASRTPTDAEELSIALEELRSQVAEAGLLADRAGRGDLTRTFVREHSHQLEKHMHASVDELRAKGSKSRQQAATEQATMLGGAALASLQRLENGAAPASALQGIAAEMAATARELTRLDRALQQHAP